MKNLDNYIIERGPAPIVKDIKVINRNPAINMIKTIIDELSNNHNDCKYDKKSNKFIGKDADLWKGAGQFLYDYLNDLNQQDFNEIIKYFKWEKWIPDINDINPADICVCISLYLQK